MDLFTYMEDEIYELCLNQRPVNIFKDYLSYLNDMGRLTADEQQLYDGAGREFLNDLETTHMTMVYKMPVLRAFYNSGIVHMSVSEERLHENPAHYLKKSGKSFLLSKKAARLLSQTSSLP